MTAVFAQRAVVQLIRTLMEGLAAQDRSVFCREIAAACFALAADTRPSSVLRETMEPDDTEDDGE